MKYGKLVFEKKDFVMILQHREKDHYIEDYWHKDALQRLEEHMADATVYDREKMPEDILRLYSCVTTSSGSGWRKTFQVVLPHERDINQDMISVQSGLGAAVIGRAEGDLVKYGTPIGIIPLKIERVEQSAGYIRDHIPTATYQKFLSKRQRAFLSNVKTELV